MAALHTSAIPWGKLPDGSPVALYNVTNSQGYVLRMTNYGARIVSLEMPDRHGDLANITLGFNSISDYLRHTAHFGGTIGRFASVIDGGKFILNGKSYSLPLNSGVNHLHGGHRGFDHRRWDARQLLRPRESAIEFTRISPDGEEGYPGNLTTTVTYTLTEENELRIDFEATADQDTIINLTNHAYWNLNGAGSGDVLSHELMIAADQYLEMDDSLSFTGNLLPVAKSVFDFRTPHPIGQYIAPLYQTACEGYDLGYALRNPSGQPALAARLTAVESGRTMEVYTDQPGLVLYTANYLDGDPVNGGYPKHAAVCLETEHYPDSPNHASFPTTVLKAGDVFRSTTNHKFSCQ